MSLTRRLNLRSVLRRCAQAGRSRAPGLFGYAGSNPLLRAVYRRLAHPSLSYSTVYTGHASSLSAPLVDETTDAYNAMLTCLNREKAVWNPGKRIDA
jgi:hypothetical protein